MIMLIRHSKLTRTGSSSSCKFALACFESHVIFLSLSLPCIRMSMILEAHLPLPRSATNEELFSMGLQEHLRPSAAPGDHGVASAEDEEIVLCF